MIQALKTPKERFLNLPDYPFEPHYCTLTDGLEMHFVDEGPSTAPVVLLLHGEPSWSFLYRKMIPIFVEQGYRVVAPDLIGFGKSDKPVEKSAYTYQTHIQWGTELIEQLNLSRITLFCQDWGGLIGLRIALEQAERFERIVAANTFLPAGQGKPADEFLQWRTFSQTVEHFPIGKVLDGATQSTLSEAVLAAYNAPFPDESYKAGARQFPSIVPLEADDPEAINNQSAWAKYMHWEKPFLTLFSDSDPITKGGEKVFQKLVPGAQGQKHQIIEGGGHFLQEDKGDEIAELVVEFMKATS